MDDLISRKALNESIRNDAPRYVPLWVYETIKKEPTVDAAPVVHGEWIWWPDNDGCDYECSNPKCRCRISYNGSKVSGDFNYCPNCGAKMDGGDKE